jgi:adenosylcobinamide-phosphate synthase
LDLLLGDPPNRWHPVAWMGQFIVWAKKGAPAACLAGENAIAAWCTMWAQHGRTASPNAGWTMSAMAGALGVTLEKTGFYRLGGGATPLSAGVIRRATRLAGLTMALFALLLVLVLLLVGLWPLV